MMAGKSGRLFVVSAPSGAGKTTLVNEAIAKLSHMYDISRLVTYTTKSPRKGESIEGVDYHFLSHAEFENKIAQNFFLEWSNAYGHYYGSPESVRSCLQQGRSIIAIVDRAGAMSIKHVLPSSVLIWIHTSSLDLLHRRLLVRGGESQEQVAMRLRLAQEEITQEDRSPQFDVHILNDEFSIALRDLCSVFVKNILQ